ncbi:MAG: hypothetical protein ABJF23_30510 [Bryobacteraceae bacterium]
MSGKEGELVSVRVSVEPRLLEDLLESLAAVSFPVNPQIFHGRPTVVEFPAYELRIEELRLLLQRAGFDSGSVQIYPMLDAISLA